VHVLWHQDSPHLRVRHWDDHTAERAVPVPAAQRDAASLHKAGQFLAAPHNGRFGCGTARGFDEYERYAGLDFARRLASAPAHRGDEPPPPPPITVGPGVMRTWQPRITLNRAALPAGALEYSPFWYVGFHDVNGVEIDRQDVRWGELQRLLAVDSQEILIERTFTSKRVPVSWTVWPTDRRRQWLSSFSGPVETECLA
jgi:hypothetical protein